MIKYECDFCHHLVLPKDVKSIEGTDKHICNDCLFYYLNKETIL